MKPTVIKFIMVPFHKDHLLLIRLQVKFLRLAQVEQRNGTLNLHNPQLAWNHFGLLIIFLVLEDHSMPC
jgi:hypothetical protein